MKTRYLEHIAYLWAYLQAKDHPILVAQFVKASSKEQG